MNNKLNINNSNKLIIGVSILFCTVILIIGTAFAYFTQSTSKEMDTIVSNDQLLLEYKDELNNFMRGDLIPSSKENAIIAYNREGENKCIDDYGYFACSIYRFSIKNISNVSQSLIMTLNPTANSFTNLKFMLYEVTNEGNNLIQDTTDLIKENYEPIPLYKSYDLDDNKTRIFELVFYIEAKDEDQTGVDSGKRFGAGIKINSVTTGKYIAQGFGESCWNLDETNPEKLVKFNGINHDTGEIDEMCTGYVSQDEYGYYSINIPSNVGGQDVTILGNNLFNAIGEMGEDGPILNKYVNIKDVLINEGIKIIEDGELDEKFLGAFMGIFAEDYNLNINFSESLSKIGSYAFYGTSLKSINIPANVQEIGESVFSFNSILTTIIFSGAEDGTSKLKMIGDNAFSENFGGGPDSILIPANVETIGEAAFYDNNNLTSITFAGAEDSTSKLKTISDYAFSENENLSSVIIPSSVEFIGEDAFKGNEKLTTLKFIGALDGTSKLQTIETDAFKYCDLTYETEDNPLILPKTISSLGYDVFYYNNKLKYIFFAGDSSNFPHDWYRGITVITQFPNNNHLNVVG